MQITILTFFILTGCLTFLCGWLVGYHRKLELLALYDAEATKDKKGLARWAGSNLMVMACLQLVCGLAGLLSGIVVWPVLGFIALTLFNTIILALGTAEYSKRNI